ncbi:MAG: SAP domain-containing protein [Candidatus Omnitrophica bacterium]|nr:SAP domain-containing protein [Candidatus Omnitrophota bacterium]
MRLSEVEKRAKSLGIRDTWRLSKRDLIKIIQRTEGNTDCFGTKRGSCEQLLCCWRSDCIR